MALAIRVLPTPGGPMSRMPLGGLTLSSRYLYGFFSRSMTSSSSSLR